MFGEWDGLMMVLGITFLIIYGIVLLFRFAEKRMQKVQWQYKCTHEDELNHDRIACYQRQCTGAGTGIALFFILAAIMPKH